MIFICAASGGGGGRQWRFTRGHQIDSEIKLVLQGVDLRLEDVKGHLIGPAPLGQLLVVLVHVRAQVTRIAVVLHQLVDVTGGLVKDVPVALVLGHVLL